MTRDEATSLSKRIRDVESQLCQLATRLQVVHALAGRECNDMARELNAIDGRLCDLTPAHD